MAGDPFQEKRQLYDQVNLLATSLEQATKRITRPSGKSLLHKQKQGSFLTLNLSKVWLWRLVCGMNEKAGERP